MPTRRIRNARLLDGSVVDLAIVDDHVSDRDEATNRTVREGDVDLAGMLLLPAGAEPHTHLDKALVFDRLQPQYGGLKTGIAQWQEHARDLDETDFVERARTLALRFVANGVTAVRTHAEIFPSGDPLRCIRALATVRSELADTLTLQIVVLPKNGIEDAVIDAAVDAGAEIIGGSPHNAPEPNVELDRLLAIARRRSIGIDIHADERLDATSLTVHRLAKALIQLPLSPGATAVAGHCVSLGLLEPAALAPIAADIRAAGIGVVAAPITNLYLQGREHPVGTPRGIAPARALLSAGVTVAGAGDNVRDPLNPLGAADHLATAALLVIASHLTIEEAYTAVSTTARTVMGLSPAGMEPGMVADYLAVDATTLGDALSSPALSRTVMKGGRVVSRRTVEQQRY